MPKGIINAIKTSELKSGKSEKKAESIAYGRANIQGYMHGSKETKKGATAEAKFERDHSKGKK